jgi:hypothetical protein
MGGLSAERIRELLEALNAEPLKTGIRGEVYLLGGAVLCLVYDARAATKGVDAYFRPAKEIREAARRVAMDRGAPEDWLNDAAKGYLSERGAFAPYLELGHLTIAVATAEYLLAMKCLAMRLGLEFHDEADVRYLLRYLNLTSYQAALDTIGRFYPLERYPQKTLYALEEILSGGG